MTTITKSWTGNYEVKINGHYWGEYTTEAEAKKMAESLKKMDIGN